MTHVRSLPSALRPYGAALRLLLVFTAVLGLAYPAAVTAIAQLPGLRARADGSTLTRNGVTVGSALLGQSFTDRAGRPLRQYFQSRPSAVGNDPTSTGGSNLGPESVVDALPDPRSAGDTGAPSLLTQVCARSLTVGRLEGVDGSRPYCTADGVGAVLAVFYARPSYRGRVVRVVSVNQACPARPFTATYGGVRVSCARYGEDLGRARIVPVRGTAPAHPVVPADAVTASGSGVDPEISLGYAHLQEARVARVRGIGRADVAKLVDEVATGRDAGVLGEAKVNVLRLNLALDAEYPYSRRR